MGIFKSNAKTSPKNTGDNTSNMTFISPITSFKYTRQMTKIAKKIAVIFGFNLILNKLFL